MKSIKCRNGLRTYIAIGKNIKNDLGKTFPGVFWELGQDYPASKGNVRGLGDKNKCSLQFSFMQVFAKI